VTAFEWLVLGAVALFFRNELAMLLAVMVIEAWGFIHRPSLQRFDLWMQRREMAKRIEDRRL